MKVSWNWLADYVDLDMSHDELVDRLTMSGLNHEDTDPWGEDSVVDLEVTSNRADCLGHLGVAREIAVLYDRPLRIPQPEFTTAPESIGDHCAVEIQCPESCYRYTARLIRGVKIGPSPQWLQDRLTALGIGVVNNVVDVTNYVMLECGQPLHAFDFQKVAGGKIIVREARPEETFEAIDHRTYDLQPPMCVIADPEQGIALGGVMGGADSEISDATTEILLEAAYFDPLSVRNTSRHLKLESPSQFRFERSIDSHQLDWASRRACQLIQELAGGEVLSGCLDVGQPPAELPQIQLRLAQIQRILGIEIPVEFVRQTLQRLGMTLVAEDADSLTLQAPSWRQDLTREIDLIEEVGRIYGFDQIPDDARVPMAASHRSKRDRLLQRVRTAVTAAGFDEAVTASLIPQAWSEAFSPWTDAAPMVSSQPMLGVLEEYSKNIGAVNLLRRSLVPSLLEVRRINEYRSNPDAALFETATVYLPTGAAGIPQQPSKLALVGGGSYFELKGVLESMVQEVNATARLTFEPCDLELLDATAASRVSLNGKPWGWLGEVSKAGRKRFGLRSAAVVAEIDLDQLQQVLVEIPQYQLLSQFPPVTRDFNLIVEDSVSWAQLESTVAAAAGQLAEQVDYRETFRDESKDGPGKKRILLTVVLRSDNATLTGEQADEVSTRIVQECQHQHGAVLVGA